jgi:hypothetical protein
VEVLLCDQESEFFVSVCVCVVCDSEYNKTNGRSISGNTGRGTKSKTCSVDCQILYQKDFKRRKTYGVGLKEFEEKLQKQKFCCAICETKEPGGKGWCLDHNHLTGVIREILCQDCNLLLGRVESNMKRHEKLIAYLKKWSGNVQ